MVWLLLEHTAGLAQRKLDSAPSELYKERKTRDNTVGSPGKHAAFDSSSNLCIINRGYWIDKSLPKYLLELLIE